MVAENQHDGAQGDSGMGEQRFVTKDDGNAVLVLEGAFTIEHAGMLRNTLHESLTRARVVELDMEAVGPVDITFLQLLVAAHKTAASLGRTLKAVGKTSQSILRLMEDSGAELPFVLSGQKQKEV